jgi:hypothetical protein
MKKLADMISTAVLSGFSGALVINQASKYQILENVKTNNSHLLEEKVSLRAQSLDGEVLIGDRYIKFSNPKDDLVFAQQIYKYEFEPLKKEHEALQYKGLFLDPYYEKTPFNFKSDNVQDMAGSMSLWHVPLVARPGVIKGLKNIQPDLKLGTFKDKKFTYDLSSGDGVSNGLKIINGKSEKTDDNLPSILEYFFN